MPDRSLPRQADDWDRHWQHYAEAARLNPAQHYRHRRIIALLGRLGARAGDSVLDVGSGQGDLLALLEQAVPGLRLTGLEMSASGVEISRRKVPSASFYQADLFQPPAELARLHGRMRFATCSEVLEHVDEPAEFLVRLRAYLQPGGELVVTVPGGPMSAFDRHIGHRQHFTTSRLGALARQAGYQTVRLQSAGFPFFNLYRLAVIFARRRIIASAETGPGRAERMLGGMFGALFRLNLPASPLGWQVIGILRRPQ